MSGDKTVNDCKSFYIVRFETTLHCFMSDEEQQSLEYTEQLRNDNVNAIKQVKAVICHPKECI